MRNRTIVLSEIKNAVAEERRCQIRVLHLLREVERDRHFLEMGYPSLFEFATKELGYSDGAAQRRIQSMRLMKAVPEVERQIEEGRLSLCVAAKTQSFFRQEDKRRKGEERLSLEGKKEIIQAMMGVSSRECERKLAEISPESAIPQEKVRALSDAKTLIQFVADAGLMEKLEKLKGLLAHQNFEGKIETLIEILADMALKKLEPKGDAPEKPIKQHSLPTLAFSAKKSRFIPIAVKRQVWLRDQGRCTYEDQAYGRKCDTRHGLQYDHVHPYAFGGQNTPENLRLRCGAHNRFTALSYFGFSANSGS